MDPVSTDILSKLGVQAAKELIAGIIRYWEERKKKKLSAVDKKEIAQIAQEMIVAATLDDVKRFDPKVTEILMLGPKRSGKTTLITAMFEDTEKRKSAAKKRSASKATHRKATGKKSSTQKKAATKHSSSKRAR
jgi:GTPase SAR1 family protein